MRVELVKRPQQSVIFSALSPFIALGLTVIAGGILFALLGKNPFEALHSYFIVPISGLWDSDQVWQLHKLAIKAAPLVLIAVGLAVCYQSNNWNIGAEGQLIMGAVAGSLIPILLPGFQNIVTLPLMLLAGMIGGALYAGIPALLKTRFNTNEILTSLMLTYVAVQLLYYLVQGPWKDPMGFNFPQTARFTSDQVLPYVVPGTILHAGFPIAIIVALVAWFVMSRSLFGFRVKVVGAAPQAARYGGFSANATIWMVLLVSGGLAGLAGVIEATGTFQRMTPSFPMNYGFTAIIVAFLGRLNPLGVIFAGLVLAVVYVGGEVAQTTLRLPAAATGIFQALTLFFLLGSDVLVRYRLRRTAPLPLEAKP